MSEEQLKLEKLHLEVESLRHQLSNSTDWLEWVKAASGPVAVLGLILSAVLGAWQIRIATESRLEDRYQKQIAHLGSTSASERLTGIAGLSSFIFDPFEKDRHQECIGFLVNALAVEQDANLRGAIMDVIGRLDPSNRDQAVLATKALELLVARNRVVTRLHIFSVEELTAEGADNSPALGAVQDSGKLISLLMRKGIRSKDLSGIACIGCDLSNTKGLDDTDFSRAVLANANFTGSELRQADFSDSILSGARFRSADLHGAKLGENFRLRTHSDRNEKMADNIAHLIRRFNFFNPLGVFPDFSCADLSDANLRGRPLFALQEFSKGGRTLTSANFDSADLARTNLDSFNFYYLNTDSNRKPEDILDDIPWEAGATCRVLSPSGIEKSGFFSCQVVGAYQANFSSAKDAEKFDGFARQVVRAKNVDKAVLDPAIEFLRKRANPPVVGTETSSTNCETIGQH